MTNAEAGRDRPVAQAWGFFALTYLWSWSSWGLAIASGAEWTDLPAVLFYVAGGFGPSCVGVLLVYLGRAGEAPSVFWRRVWDVRRIRARCYVAIAAIAFGPSLVAKLAPGTAVTGAEGGAGALAAILIVAVGAALAEELGWRGYALDRLLSKHDLLTASLVVGVAWTLWHLPFYFMAGTIQNEAGLWSQDFWSDMVTRVPLAVVFGWIYVRTRRSILSVVLLHALDNVASVVLDPHGVELIVRLVIVTALAGAVSVRSPSVRPSRP